MKGKSTVILREIDTKEVAGTSGFMSCQVEPIKGSFRGIRFQKRVSGYNGVPYVSFEYGGCRVHEAGQTYYNSWYA